MKKLQTLKTFADACKVLGLDAKKVIPDFSGYPKKDSKAMLAHAKLVIIVRAANLLANDGKEWTPDWKDSNQRKYCAWFYIAGSGGFRFFGYVYWYSHSAVGSRLCFISAEVAEYVGRKFIGLYEDYFLM